MRFVVEVMTESRDGLIGKGFLESTYKSRLALGRATSDSDDSRRVVRFLIHSGECEAGTLISEEFLLR